MNRAGEMDRREFLGAAAGLATSASLALSQAVSTTQESPANGLGIVIYALGVQRRRLKAETAKRDLFSPPVFLDYCHQLGAGGIQIPLGTLDPDACQRLLAQADAYGMFIEGIVGPPFADADAQRFEAEIETAARVGARAVRTVILPGRRYEQYKTRDEFDRDVARGQRALTRAKPIVERHQVRLAVENHKDQRLDERVALLTELDSPFIGACVDVGNSFALLEDPLEVVTALAPWAFTVHIKDQAVQEYREGFLLADVALGDGFLDLKQMVAVLRQAQADIRFSLESITRDALRVPCLAESYWPTLTAVPGRDLARTLATVRKHASSQLPSIGQSSLEEQAAIEHTLVTKSLAYAQAHLHL